MKKKITAGLAWLCICMLVVSFSAVIQSGDAYAGQGVKIKLNKQKISVTAGSRVKLKAVVSPKKGNKIVWKSLNTRIATVSKKGQVKGIKAGSTKIVAGVKGKKAKAVCIVNVKKKTRPAGTKTPDNSPGDEPTQTTAPGETKDPTQTAVPDETKAPYRTEEPTQTAAPGITKEPTQTAAPGITKEPTQTVAPGITKEPLPTAVPSDMPGVTQPSPTVSAVPSSEPKASPVVATKVANIKGQKMTVYIIDITFDGEIHFSFFGNEFVQNGSAKDALVLLSATYTSKTNKEETLRISREFPDENWIIENLVTGETYTMKVEVKNTFDKSYKDCGAIYISGDVTSQILIY